MPSRPIRQLIAGQQLATVTLNTPVRTAVRMMRDRNTGSVLVVDAHGSLCGIFTERDALNRVLAAGVDPDGTAVERVMTANPLTADSNHPVVFALHLMHDGGFRHLPIVENDKPVGVISIRDAMGLELASFEEDVARKEELTEVLAY